MPPENSHYCRQEGRISQLEAYSKQTSEDVQWIRANLMSVIQSEAREEGARGVRRSVNGWLAGILGGLVVFVLTKVAGAIWP